MNRKIKDQTCDLSQGIYLFHLTQSLFRQGN